MSDRIPPLTAEIEHLAALATVAEIHLGEAPLVARALRFAIQESQPATEADVERVARAIEFYVGATASKTFKDSAARAAILAMGKTLPEEKTDG